MGERILTPLRTIRLKCMDCSGDCRKEVELCPVSRCSLWPYRFGKIPNFKKYTAMGFYGEAISATVASTSARAIKVKCKDCNGPDFTSCDVEGFGWCPLLQYQEIRKKKKRVISDEERVRRSEQMHKLRLRRIACEGIPETKHTSEDEPL